MVLAACTCLGALALPSAASAKPTPCWLLVVRDWSDNGFINKVYAKKCYTQALKHLPPDIGTYSNARDDIERALAQVKKNHLRPGGNMPYTTTKTETLPNGKKTTKTFTTAAPTTTDKNKGAIGVIDHINPSSPDAFPLPLLILGALAIVLVLAGLGGMLYRRYWGGEPDGTGSAVGP